NPFSVPGEFQALIYWGDGDFSPGVVVKTGGVYQVLGQHLYFLDGGYTIQVAIADVDGARVGAATAAAVVKAPPVVSGVTAVAVEGNLFQGTVAQFVDITPNATPTLYSAMINWGDNSFTPATAIVPDGLGSFLVVGSHVYATLGMYFVTTTVTQTGGLPGTG